MQFKKTTLTNGVRVILLPLAESPAVTVLVMTETGSKSEEKRLSGISHFLEHVVFKGTKKRPTTLATSLELDAIGAEYNAFTAQEFTGFYAKAHARHFDVAYDVITDIYLNPIFDPAELEKEKGVVVEEIRMYQDMPQRHVEDILLHQLYGDTPAGRNITGTEETVKSFTREDIDAYHKSHYTAESTIVVLAGAFDEASALQKLEHTFSVIPVGDTKITAKAPVVENQSAPSLEVKYKETDQTHVILAVRTFPVVDTRVPVLQLITTILSSGFSSRLVQRLREKMGIVYYVRSGIDSFIDHGFFSVSAGLDSSRLKQGIEAIIDELKKISTELVPESELRKAKDQFIGSMMLSLDSSDSLADFVGYQEIMKKNIKTPDEIAARIEAITAADILSVAKEIFVDKGLNLSGIGRLKEPEIQMLISLLTFK